MIKIIKSNKTYILLLITICLIFILSPATYIQSSLNAISLWATKVLPSLLPFFIITRSITALVTIQPNPVDRLMNKIYHTGSMSGITLFLSLISGYPMGAKLICNLYEDRYIDRPNAIRMMSFCSVSGPMFMVGTVGVGVLLSFKAGIIIMLANILSALINGLLYRGDATCIKNECIYSQKNHQSLQDIVYDSLVSIMMVGGFMLISFLFIDLLNNLHIIPVISNAISSVSNQYIDQDIVSSILNGSIEITRGIVDLSHTSCDLRIKTIIASSLISLGGISIILQSLSFLTKLKINPSIIIKQKLTQCAICIIISTLLAIIFI